MMLASGIDWQAGSFEAVCAAHRYRFPERFNIAVAACDFHARGDGRLALVCTDTEGRRDSVSFDRLRDITARFASALAQLGVERGDRVAIFLPQRLETAVGHLATLRLGAISVPLSPLFRAEALATRLRDSGARVVLTDAEHRPFLAAALPRATLIECESDFQRLVDEGDAELPAADTAADDPAMLVYTSGTSGPPKGALHAHRFLPGRLAAFELIHRLESDPERERPFFTPAEWAWVGGLVDCVLTPLVFGCPVLAWRRRAFDARAAWELIARERVRGLFLPPTALHLMQRNQPPDSLSVVSVHSAGEPLPAATCEWASRTVAPIYELYGMTEIGALIGNCSLFPVRPGSMGKSYPGHQVALLDASGQSADEGEIAIKRPDPGLFLGYWNAPEATAERFSGDWFRTGDLARRDQDGYFHYLGRADDVFNASGYRIGPTEIESCLERHPAVERAAVIGEPDADRGHLIKAVLVLRAGHAPSDRLRADIQGYVRERLAVWQVPRRLEFVSELPLTVTGKLRRSALRQPEGS